MKKLKFAKWENYEKDGIKYIPGTVGYYACASGDIFKLFGIDSKEPYLKKVTSSIRKSDDYCVAAVTWIKIGRKVELVHRLIAKTFLGECPKGYEVNHKDHVRYHNFLSNIEYKLIKENRGEHCNQKEYQNSWRERVADKALYDELYHSEIRIFV